MTGTIGAVGFLGKDTGLDAIEQAIAISEV